MKNEIITKILYVIATCCFLTYLFTKKSIFMFFGGIFMIIASIMLMATNKKNNKK